jgi:hypothetical protein
LLQQREEIIELNLSNSAQCSQSNRSAYAMRRTHKKTVQRTCGVGLLRLDNLSVCNIPVPSVWVLDQIRNFHQISR